MRPVATQALRRKKAAENQLDQLAGQRLQLEMQVNTIESANLNAETMMAMKKGSDALKAIHGNMSVLFNLIGFFSADMAAIIILMTLAYRPEPLTKLTRRSKLSMHKGRSQTRFRRRFRILWVQDLI
jgi:Snf7